MVLRRTVRDFSDRAGPPEVLREALRTAAAAPGGANVQPWWFAKESVGIAVGLLLAALHQAGLATLTHTSSPDALPQRAAGRRAEERGNPITPATSSVVSGPSCGGCTTL